ncbi:MAG: hypothetical protein ABFR95_04640 [Actinomycetota bacterium]
MPRSRRTSPCTRQHAVNRLSQAESFAELATIVDPGRDPGPDRSAAVANAVLAAIAAADALCCARLGVHAAGNDHREAVRLLKDVAEVGAETATALSTLLGLKQKAQYGATDPSAGETVRAVRAMQQIIEFARAVV